MRPALRRKTLLGFWRFMLPLPQLLVRRDIQNAAQAICRKTVDISEEERRVHRLAVSTITETREPVMPEVIARELEMPLKRVHAIVVKLESLKVFLYRYNNVGINWAYPVTAEDQRYRMSFSSGEHFYAA